MSSTVSWDFDDALGFLSPNERNRFFTETPKHVSAKSDFYAKIDCLVQNYLVFCVTVRFIRSETSVETVECRPNMRSSSVLHHRRWKLEIWNRRSSPCRPRSSDMRMRVHVRVRGGPQPKTYFQSRAILTYRRRHLHLLLPAAATLLGK